MTDARGDWDKADPWNYSGGPKAARARGLPPLRLINPTEWQGKPIPPRAWIVERWIPVGEVTLLTGDGGLGKTLIAQMLATCCATGTRWLGLEVERCRAMLIACEDTEEELMRRQAAINAALGVTFADLGDLRLSSRVGLDNVLMADRRDGMGMEPLYDKICEEAEMFGPGVLILDSLHDLFGANENSRPQVRFFVNALARLARDMEGAVLLNAHPSLSGLNSGSGTSGSTAWHNSVRSRFYLTAPRAGEVDGRDYRELKSLKANYAAAGSVIRVQYQNGVFIPDDGHKAPATMVDRIEFDGRALEEMRTMIAEGTEITADQFSRVGFANILRKRDGFRQVGQGAVIACQKRLLDTGKAVLVPMGSPSRRRTYIRPADAVYAREGKSPEGSKL